MSLAAEPTALPSQAPPARREILGIVFTTILLDFIGFSVLIPVLPIYAKRLGASSVEVGLIVSLYAAAQLLFLPAWGWLSDRVGRRPVLLSSLFGTVLSFLLLALSDTLGMIYLARVLAGIFAASIGTAQAVVTDVTPESERAHGMGVIGAAFGLGFVVGPALGGALAAWSERAPFYAIALLAATNLAVAWLRLPESHPRAAGAWRWDGLGRSFVPTPVRLLAAVHDRRIGLYLYLFFHLFTAFSALESMFTVYVFQRFGMGPGGAARIFTVIGVFIALTQGVLIRRLAPRLGERALVVGGLVLTAGGLLAIPFAPTPGWLYGIGPLIAIGNGLAFPSFTSLYSRATETESAGELLGQSQSMATTGRIAGPLWAGWALDRVALGAPFVIAGVLMAVGLGLFLAFRRLLLGSEAATGGAMPR